MNARAWTIADARVRVTTRVVPGGAIIEHWAPVGRVGLYAPGDLAGFPSSVVIDVVPAQLAGVDLLVVCSATADGVCRTTASEHPGRVCAARRY
jgi:histidinol dehydrogenase